MSSTLKNLGWKFLERIASQLVQLIVSIVLARILVPSDYGVVAMVIIFITLANVFVDGGFSSALIQKKNADSLDFSTVFYFSCFFASLLYVLLFLTAPLITKFYGEGYEVLTKVFRILGIQLIISSVNSVQQAYVQKKMMFKNFFWATSFGSWGSALIGLSMAYLGFGIWSLVGQQLTASIINTLTLYVVTRKLPILAFSFERLRELYKYGIKLLGVNIMIIGFEELRGLIIGKMYSSQDLAFFNRAKQFPSIVVSNVNSSIGSVLFPRMAKEQDDLEQVKNTTRMSIRFSSYVMFPIMMGLIVISEPFVRIVLTEKWVDCVPIMQWFCVMYLFMPIHTANMQAIKAIGKSDTLLVLEIIKKIIELVTLICVMWISVEAIIISMSVLATFFTVINAYPNSELLKYGYKEQVLDIYSPLLMSLVMVVCVLLFNSVFTLNDWELIIFDSVIGVVIYVTLSSLTKNIEYKYICSIFRNKFLNF